MRGAQPIKEAVKAINFWNFDEQNKLFVHHQTEPHNRIGEFLRPHRLRYFAIRWFINGGGTLLLDHVPYDIRPNTFMLAGPTQISSFQRPKVQSDYEIKVIAFDHSLVSMMDFDESTMLMLSGTASHLFYQMTDAQLEIMRHYFTLIEKEYANAPNNQRDQILAYLIKALILQAIRANDGSNKLTKNTEYNNLYREFLEALEEHFKEKHTLSEYADLLNVNDKRLSRACKAITNVTPGKIIQRRLDYEAKRLLYYTTNNVKEIGYHLGFKDPAHFNKFFKNINGYNPGALRKPTPNE
ncbi:MAG: AraC family transcriptional regulator [Cyclobacteriaceae bacterium]